MEVIVGLVIAIGVLGTLIPILPGLALVWIAALGYGLVDGFGPVGGIAFALITGLVALGLWLGIRLPQRSAAEAGLSWAGQLLAVAFAVVGFFAIPVVGAGVGFVAGVFVAVSLRSRTVAWGATGRTIGAMVRAAFAQFLTAGAAAATWLVWALVAG
jgi:hypothetical protein